MPRPTHDIRAIPGPMARSGGLWLGLAMGALAGCTTVIHPRVPPSRVGPVGPPEGLLSGETRLAAQMYLGTVGNHELAGGQLEVTHAFLPTVALRAEGYFLNDEVWDGASGAGRVGVALSPVEHLSFHLGGGIGGGEGGAFGGPDVGLTLGYVNPHFVPFLSWSGSYTVPLGDDRPTVRTVNYSPQETFRHAGHVGFSLPFNPGRPDEVAFRLAVGIGQSLVLGSDAAAVGTSFREEDEEPVFSFLWGISVRLGDPLARHPNAD